MIRAILLLSAATLSAQIPGMDMAVMQKWSKAKVIRFQVSGVHKSRSGVVFGDHEGKADIVDKLIVEYTWDNKKGQIQGEPKIIDVNSETMNVKADGTNCPPPTLKGAYEHFKMQKYSVSGGRQLQITGSKIYPAASVSQYPASCSMKAVPGGTVEQNLFLTLMDASMLGMPIPAGNKSMSVAADRKSFTLNGADNWSWTYTPNVVE
jgi:hypothetical protein